MNRAFYHELFTKYGDVVDEVFFHGYVFQTSAS